MYERPFALQAMVSGQAELDEMASTLAIPEPARPAAAGPDSPPEPAPGVAMQATAGPDSQADPWPGVVMQAAADIKTLPVQWLWKPRLPLGALSLFAGDPKLGKSFVTLDLAAAVSRGAPLPLDDGHYDPASVVLMSAEDDPGRTIVPRLKSAGANLSNVYILDAVLQEDGTHALPRLRSDIERIGDAVEKLGDCRLVVIDPVSAYLGGVDDHRNAELRGVLSPLKWLAEDLELAVVLVSHLNKGASPNGQHRVAGSIAYVGACRANFLFHRDRRDPSGRRVLMLDNGCNLAASVPTLAYQIEDRGDGPVVAWEADAVPITTEDALRAFADDQNDRGEARACEQWLRQKLSAGAVPVAELFGSGRDAGFSKDQLKRAKKRVGAATQREGFGTTSTCAWVLHAGPSSPGD
jgi:RecA-family ATPase